MIRINLLPVKRKKKVQPVPAFVIQSVAVFGVVALVLIGVVFYLSGKVSGLREDQAKKEKELVELQAKLQEVLNYEKDNESYRQKNAVIQQLKKNQDIPLKLLDEVSKWLTDGVWLVSLTDKGSGVDIAGYAFTNSDLVAYVQNLKKSGVLTDVELLESRQTKFEEVQVYQFRLTFRVKV